MPIRSPGPVRMRGEGIGPCADPKAQLVSGKTSPLSERCRRYNADAFASDVVRLAAFAELLIVDQSRFGPQRHRAAVAERPFAAIAILGPDIAVDVEAAQMVRAVRARTVDQIGVPEREIARFEV